MMSSTPTAREYPRAFRIVTSVTDALQQLFRDSLSVQAHIDIDAILTTVTSGIADELPVTCVAILMRVDPGTSRVVVADRAHPGVAHYIDEYVSTLISPGVAPTTGMSQRVIEAGGPVFKSGLNQEEYMSLISPVGQAYFAAHPFPVKVEPVTLLMVPMRSGRAIVGTMALLDWGGGTELSQEDVDWMQTVADRTGITVDSAQLRNRAIDRIDRLVALGDVSLAIRSSQDMRLTLKLILERLLGTLHVDAADILLIDEATKTFHVAVSAGFRATSNTELRFPTPHDMARTVVIERTAGGGSSSGEWMGQQRRWVFAREGFRTYIAAPIIVREVVAGAIELFSRAPLEPDQEWEAFLEVMATQTAIGIDNSSMHEALQRDPSSRPPRRLPAPLLTEREREILNLVVGGASNRELAETLHLSQNTIKFHIRQLLEKAGVSNRTELAARAVQQAWV
jgi:DNA-binding CsgD family transcriptional regulator